MNLDNGVSGWYPRLSERSRALIFKKVPSSTTLVSLHFEPMCGCMKFASLFASVSAALLPTDFS